MVDLAEFVWTLGAKIDYKAATKIILNLNHVASHYTVLAGNYLFTEFTKLSWVFKCFSICFRENFGSVFLSWLLAEAYSEHVILYWLDKLSQGGHIHWQFFSEMIATIHAFEDVFWNV